MGKYFIYCNNNQVYHALIHNSIFSRDLTREDFHADTASFLGGSAIFVTKEILSRDLRQLGTTEIYYPVTLEILDADESSVIPVRFAFKNDDMITISDQRELLGSYMEKENCFGAFVCGEIPISLLNGIYFENQQELKRFKLSSPDLWFPEELFTLRERSEKESSVTKEELLTASEKLEAILDRQNISAINSMVFKRSKMKARGYFMTTGTENWEAGRIKSNIDGTLIRFLDDEAGRLKNAVECCCEQKKIPVSCTELIERWDPAMENDPAGTDGSLYQGIIAQLMDIPDSADIDERCFDSIAEQCMKIPDDSESAYCGKCFNVIKRYVYTGEEMDPDHALAELEELPVLRAFMLFLDQRKNFDFLKNACRKLNQYERRYAYTMFGAYHGMAAVEGSIKCNRQLERRLTEISMKRYGGDWLVSALPDPPAGDTFGITPEMEIWYDCEESQNLLLNKASNEQLEALYKAGKDRTIPEEAVYSLSEMITIKVVFQGEEHQYTISRKEDIKSTIKELEKAVAKFAKSGVLFQASEFRKRLSDRKAYEKFYKKNCGIIQECCKKVDP